MSVETQKMIEAIFLLHSLFYHSYLVDLLSKNFRPWKQMFILHRSICILKFVLALDNRWFVRQSLRCQQRISASLPGVKIFQYSPFFHLQIALTVEEGERNSMKGSITVMTTLVVAREQ